ncbi:MAG: hypothetical protein AAGD35_23060 [Actinomycetota bacterium]
MRNRVPAVGVVVVIVAASLAACSTDGSGDVAVPGGSGAEPATASASESEAASGSDAEPAVDESAAVVADGVGVDDDWLLTSFTYYPLDQTQPTDMNAGFSMYVAAWPFQQTYPGPSYQTGLPSTWLRPSAIEDGDRELYSTIEGGLGWWNDTRFATETPKFIMGGVSLDFTEWANGPGVGAGTADVDRRDWETPQGKYGVAQLSPHVLWAPDGLNLAEGTNGGLFGYGYHPLPIIDAQTTSLGDEVATGDNSWTLFLRTGNFQGPVSFFIPNFFTKPAIGEPSLEGLFFDASGTDYGRAIGLETQVIPAATATVDGVTYARVTRMQYPATDERSSVVLHRITSYDDEALGAAVERWFDDGGPPPSGRFEDAAAHVSPFIGEEAGDDVFMTFVGEGMGEDEERPVDFGALARLDTSDPTTFRYVWNLDLVERQGDTFVLPDYFRLEGVGEEAMWRPITASEVPEATGLHQHVFDELGRRNDVEPFVTPEEPDSPWRSPGPSSGPFTAELGDGSTVTYHWYRFIDQPAMRYWGFSDAELATIQGRVESIHQEWTPDREYLAAPDVGELADLDPAVIVTPPPGMEVGYVPIVTRQERTGTG